MGSTCEIDAGECVALIGHNGSGKTTAVRVIGGLLEPSAGVVRVCGTSMHLPGALAARTDLSLVPDSPMLYGDLTVREHLELVVVAHGVPSDFLDERVDSMLERLDVDERRDAFPGQLSRGCARSCSLRARWCARSGCWCSDEPVVGLDPSTQRTLRDLLLEAKRDGAAVLLTTHQLEFARGVADRAVLLADGAVVQTGPYDEVVDGERVYERGLH